MEIPRLEKIVINMGLGDCKDNSKALELAVTELSTISGQKPLVTKAKDVYKRQCTPWCAPF